MKFDKIFLKIWSKLNALIRRRRIYGDDSNQLPNPTRDFEMWILSIVRTSVRLRSISVLQRNSNIYSSNISINTPTLQNGSKINLSQVGCSRSKWFSQIFSELIQFIIINNINLKFYF